MIKQMDIPKHIAIIMDGNGRWAKKRLLPRKTGHWFGMKKAKEIVFYAAEKGVQNLTLFAFGRENWKRPATEVSFLMHLLAEQIGSGYNDLHEKNIKIRCIGDRTRLSEIVLVKIVEAEMATQDNTGLVLNVAIDYSGQFDIIQAVNRVIQDKVNSITAEKFEEYLLTYPAPAPDLLIRTGGECRISNFLLFQIAYSECYFTNTMWPSFGRKELDKALKWFNNKERRFGMTPEQVRKDLDC